MKNTKEELLRQADKYWLEVVSRMRRDSPFIKRAIDKLNDMYNKALEIPKT